MKRDTVLFDLDGTLLPMDLDDFLRKYFRALTGEFLDLAPAEQFKKILMKATQDMIENDGQRVNREVFMESFFSMIKVEDLEKTMKRFDRFYKEKFPGLKDGLEIDDTSARLVALLKKKGYEIIVATNPLFPPEAIMERIRWAGLATEDFRYITNYNNMHYCKPNLDFYRELMDKLNLKPDRCIMVGNDMQEDIVAGKLGIETYLVEDFLIDRQNSDLKPDWRGSLKELESYVANNF